MAGREHPETTLEGVAATDRPAREAADWFARLAADDVSDDDYARYRAWRDSDQSNAAAFDGVSRAWDIAGRHADTAEILEMRVTALAERSEPGHGALQAYRNVAIAACLAFMVAVGVVLLNGIPRSGSDADGSERIAEVSPPTAQEMANEGKASPEPEVIPASLEFQSGYSTRIGQMARFELPDGSFIELNTASQVEVDYSAGERNLRLVRGEAVFTVAKDADRPFVVTAGESRVVALGTIFSVRKTDNDARVVLFEGSVRVDKDNGAGGAKSARLVPGDEIRIEANRPFAITKTQLSQAASWRNGRLIFEQTPLRDVLAEFNRYSVQQHVLGDPGLGDFLVSGTFRIESSEHFAATLEAGFPVLVRARPDGGIFEVLPAKESSDQAVPQGN